MRIAIDGRFLSHPQKGGYKTYSENLIRNLIRLGDMHRFMIYLDRPLPDLAGLESANVELHVLPGTLPHLGMPWREQALLPTQARRDRAAFLHSPCQTAPLLCPCPTVITIHDTIWAMPAIRESRSPAGLGLALYTRRIPALAMHRAQAIITVSAATRRDLVQKMGVPPEKVFVTHEAGNPLHVRRDDPQGMQALRHRCHLADEFILTLGSADPRKNLSTLVEAYGGLGADLIRRFQLVIVWCHGHLRPGLENLAGRLGLADHVRFIDNVSDSDLTLLYNAASLFVFPSHYEGFGLPPLEAMACGTPVVAGDNSSLPEVLGDAALLVDVDHGPILLAQAVASILLDSDLRKAFSARGLEWVRRYSWERCAAQTLAVYERVAGGHGREEAPPS